MALKLLPKTDVDLQKILAPLETDQEGEDPLTDFFEGREVAAGQLPDNATEIGRLENDIDHSPGLSWQVDLTLFFVPIPGEDGSSFCLLRLDWDDNWGRWDWLVEGAVSGASDGDSARAFLLEHIKKKYKNNSSDEFQEFIEGLG